MRGLGRRRMKKALEQALEGGDGPTFEDLAQRLISLCMSNDEKVALAALKRVSEEVDGKIPLRVEDDGREGKLVDLAAAFFHEVGKISPASEHEVRANGLGAGTTSSLALADKPDRV